MQYYFDVHDGVEVPDRVGLALPDREAARQHAMQVAASYAGKPEMLGEDGGAIVVTARTAEDGTVLTVRLAFGVETSR